MGDHTETVQLEYDPGATTYEALLGLFWQNHDPTLCHTRQYMSAIFYHDQAQKESAEQSFEAEEKKRGKKLATKILPVEKFYTAEDYHQKYMLRQKPRIHDSLGLSDKLLLTSHVAARLNGYAGGFGSRKQFDEEWRKLGLTEEQAEAVRPLVGQNA